VRIDENYKNVVKRCYKCNTAIEPQIRDQWFVKMQPLAEKVIGAVEKRKEIAIMPEHQKRILLHWMHNTIDWNISRQIVWGIRIPAWFRGEEVAISIEEPEGDGWTQDPDTFDTWFSSGQWPLLTLGYPDSNDFKTYYPTTLMETGADLVFKWVPRMIMFGLYRTGIVPFKTVYFHGMVNDAQNQKMSKSKGNVVSPIEMGDKYGMDALRMALVIGNPAGSNVPLSEDKIRGYKHYANKIWNVTRFILTQCEGASLKEKPPLTESDEKLLAEWHKTGAEITDDLAHYRLYLAGEKLYHYFWHTLADVIIEESKQTLSGDDAKAKASRQWTLYRLLLETLKCHHPFMPFITEEIWTHLPEKDSDLLIIAPWPIEATVDVTSHS